MSIEDSKRKPLVFSVFFIAFAIMVTRPAMAIETIVPQREISQKETWQIELLDKVKSEGLTYKDYLRLKSIAQAESKWQHYYGDKVLRGRENPKDVGLYQINETYHAKRAEKMGVDIYKPEGNIAYAVKLYKSEGSTPWLASSYIWSN